MTSITQYSRLFGLSAYWILHSPTTPRWRMTCASADAGRQIRAHAYGREDADAKENPRTLSAAERSMWYSSSESVWEGATTMESPVCVPSGSKFAMLQQMIVFCARAATSGHVASASSQRQRERGSGQGRRGNARRRRRVRPRTRPPSSPSCSSPPEPAQRDPKIRVCSGGTRAALTWGERLSPRAARSRISSSSCAKPEPRPPRVKAERMMTG